MCYVTLKGLSDQKAFTFILITMIVDGFASGIITPVYPLLLMELTKANAATAAIYGGWLSGLYATVQFFATPVLGNLSDRYGRRPVLLGSLSAFGISYLIAFVAPSVGWIFFNTLFTGAFAATFAAANAYVADITTPHDRARRFGLVAGAFTAGFTLGPVLVGLLEPFGIRAPFLLGGVLALLNVAYGFFVLPESLRPSARRSFSIRRANPLGAFLQMRSQPIVFWLHVAFGVAQIASLTVPVIWGYLTILKFGWSQSEIGISLGLQGVAVMIVQSALVSRITRRLGIEKTACLGIGCMMIGLLGYAFAPNGWVMFISIVPAALGSLAGAALISHISVRTAADSQGELQGTLATVTSVALIITPLVMTPLFSFFSTNHAPVYFPGAPYLLASVFALCALLVLVHTFSRGISPNERAPVRS